MKSLVYFEIGSTLALIIGRKLVKVLKPGAGFNIDAATLAVVPTIPLTSLALLVGIDRLMSECRAMTNLIGNGIATVVIGRWKREITKEQL